MQILEIYTVASLTSQHLLWFPTQVWQEINKAKEKLSELSSMWKWEESPLMIAGIGSPNDHIENLKQGIFRPFVPVNSIRKQKSREVPQQLDVGRQFADELFDEEQHVVNDFAGEIPLEGEFESIETDITKTLRDICTSITTRWQERQNETPLQLQTSSVFANAHDLSKLSSTEKLAFINQKVNSLLVCLPEYQRQKYDLIHVSGGFLSWNQFYLNRSDAPINSVWKQWIAQLDAENLENYEHFINLFQNVQIRSMSEAICETVGSMMVTHGGKGRYLQPSYFSMEMYLRFNLGPLHLLSDLCKEIVREHRKEYIRKDDTLQRYDRVISRHSAVLETYRKNQEEKAHLPLVMWQKK